MDPEQIGAPFIAEVGGLCQRGLGPWGPFGRFDVHEWLDQNLCLVTGCVGHRKRGGIGLQGLRMPRNGDFPRVPSLGPWHTGEAQA